MRGWNIAALAREAKISYNTVQRLWNYESQGMQFEKILRIALTLGVSLDELFPIAKQQGE